MKSGYKIDCAVSFFIDIKTAAPRYLKSKNTFYEKASHEEFVNVLIDAYDRFLDDDGIIHEPLPNLLYTPSKASECNDINAPNIEPKYSLETSDSKDNSESSDLKHGCGSGYSNDGGSHSGDVDFDSIATEDVDSSGGASDLEDGTTGREDEDTENIRDKETIKCEDKPDLIVEDDNVDQLGQDNSTDHSICECCSCHGWLGVNWSEWTAHQKVCKDMLIKCTVKGCLSKCRSYCGYKTHFKNHHGDGAKAFDTKRQKHKRQCNSSAIRSLQCNHCSMLFRSTRTEWKAHHEGCKKMVVICKEKGCRSKFQSHSGYKGHCKNKHGFKMTFSCSSCTKKFASAEDKKLHESESHWCQQNYKKSLICSTCNVSIDPTFPKWKEHSKVCGRRILCGESGCTSKFESFSGYRKHYGFKHAKKQYPCSSCDKTFATEEELDGHQNIENCQSKSNEVTYICSYCGKDCLNNVRYRKHLAYTHGRTTKGNVSKYCRFICHCQKKFQNKEELDQHKITCSTKSQIWMCSVCGVLFHSNAGYRKHKMKHGMPFKCSCQKRFATKEKLQIHGDACAKNNKYHCYNCGINVYMRTKLKEHYIKEHFSNGLFHCARCEYKDIIYRKVHVHAGRMHIAPENMCFICSKCGKRYGMKKQLTEHTRAVHGKTYSCPICNKTFGTLSSMKRHKGGHGVDG